MFVLKYRFGKKKRANKQTEKLNHLSTKYLEKEKKKSIANVYDEWRREKTERCLRLEASVLALQ